MTEVERSGPGGERRREGERGDELRSVQHLLFVCTGNTCRSPMAQAVARREARERDLAELRTRSAGTFASGGSPASGGALRMAQRHGLDLSDHRSSLLTGELLDWADLVVGMTRTHVNIARRLGREDLRVTLLSELLPEAHPARGRPVEDPVGGTDDAYERAFDVIRDAIGSLFDRIAPTHDDPPGDGEA